MAGQVPAFTLASHEYAETHRGSVCVRKREREREILWERETET